MNWYVVLGVVAFYAPWILVLVSVFSSSRTIKENSTHNTRHEHDVLSRIRRLYLDGTITEDEYADLYLYVQCGGIVSFDGSKVGISDAGFQKLQATRRRARLRGES